jgi:hypothetical protein
VNQQQSPWPWFLLDVGLLRKCGYTDACRVATSEDCIPWRSASESCATT